METEIELKFFVSAQFSGTLASKIERFKVLQKGRRELGNTYFDTPDKLLRQHDIGLRIRRFDDVSVQTLKTAGRVVAGLHQRPEYNAELSDNQLNLSLHPADAWPDSFDINRLQADLEPLFSTNFERQQWLVALNDGSQIEIAFDQGEVIAGEQRDPICEVELELKSGQTEALFSLARELCSEGGIRLGNLSKAARGYRLASGYDGDSVKALALLETNDSHTVEQVFVNSLEHALSHWHYHEQIYVERQDHQALYQIRQSIQLIMQALAVYGEIIPRRGSALIRQELKWLRGELNWLEEAASIEQLVSDKGHKMRKLDARKSLVKQLKKRMERLPSEEEMLVLFQSSRYCNLLLDLSRWILSHGWQPLLDDKSRETLSQSIRPFADEQLNYSWDELLQVFPVDSQFSADDYIGLYNKLARNLLTGVCFATLYDEEAREAFRLPWYDLLHGIEDLQQLEQIGRLLEKQPEQEDRDQIGRWLARKQSSLLSAMQQTRDNSLTLEAYWL
ncbi:inorganic triphosphatase [Thaumasiovibrio subtropicus]|uniref:CYTH and CHAD domain-containing protein n=1 Tax=Thaumasiovibrio subtropicus TaxID=1891207 RepID=UPI000B357EFB|nr:inorganic triphosphatase [Thaumasiovibrio subtropicus]